MLPADGPADLGAVRLPEGRRISAAESTVPIAWVTSEPVPDPGRLWLALSRLAAETGLQPLLIRLDHDGGPGFPEEWRSEETVRGFCDFLSELIPVPGIAEEMAALAHGDKPLLPYLEMAQASASHADDIEDVFFMPTGDLAEIDRIDPCDVLRDGWPEADDGYDEDLTAGLPPFSGEFPGLAPAIGESLPEETILAALDQFETVHIGLVPAGRPADVITASGWGPPGAWDDLEPLSAVLRSWEDRFGARLVQVGPGAEIRLLVERPPRTLAEALPVAAELWAFGDEWFGEAHNDRICSTEVPDIAPRLVNGPIWGIWWD